jgi:hypothetical protein
VGINECITDRGRDRRSGGGELQTIHELGDLGSTTGDHRVCVTGVVDQESQSMEEGFDPIE